MVVKQCYVGKSLYKLLTLTTVQLGKIHNYTDEKLN